jgi:putative photosynthetic complex assembly protein
MAEAARYQAQVLPRGALIGAAALVAFAFVAVGAGRNLGVGETHMPATQAYQILHLSFADQDDGGVTVRDAESGAVLEIVKPGTNGFLRSALRGFAHERMRDGIGPARPFTLTRWRNGTLSLQDEATGRRIDLDAFGPTQSQDFAQLFVDREVVK